MITAAQALEKLKRFLGTGGMCPDDPRALDRLNEARELIYDRGDFAGTTEWLQVDSSDGFFTLPSRLLAARAVFDCKRPLPVGKFGWAEVEDSCAASCCRPCNPPVVISRSLADRPYACKPCSIFGIDAASTKSSDKSEIALRLENRSGEIKTVSLALNGLKKVSLDGMWSDIFSINKEPTAGRINVWFRTDGGCSIAAAVEAGELFAPMAARYTIIGGCEYEQLMVYAKKRFIPLASADEPLDIQSLSAIKFALMALNAQDNGDDAEYANKVGIMEGHLGKADMNILGDEGAWSFQPNYSVAGIGI